MYDVIIIGAGPAGTVAGYLLGRAGLSVLLLDRKNFPRKKACAGGITPKAMALFPFDISCLIRRTCREVKIIRPGNASFTVKAKDPLCYITKRMDLDAYSLEKAVQAGCRFRKIDWIIDLNQNNHGVSLTLSCDGKTDIVRAGHLIGADGANSKVRRLIGDQKSRIIKLPALEADVPVKNAGLHPMTFDFSRNIRGYYWIFPRKTHVNIGIFSALPNGVMNRDLLKNYAKDRLKTDILTDVRGYPHCHQLWQSASGNRACTYDRGCGRPGRAFAGGRDLFCVENPVSFQPGPLNTLLAVKRLRLQMRLTGTGRPSGIYNWICGFTGAAHPFCINFQSGPLLSDPATFYIIVFPWDIPVERPCMKF